MKQEELEVELGRARLRIAELNEIIVGDRPDLFHDSLIRGARVTRMEDCISTLKSIVKYVDDAEQDPQTMLTSIRNTAEQIINKNPKFGMFPMKEIEK